jgi:hypothetical protein
MRKTANILRLLIISPLCKNETTAKIDNKTIYVSTIPKSWRMNLII